MSKGLKDLMRDYERTIVSQTLSRNGGDRNRVALVLKISRRALDKIIERHRICKPRFARPLPFQPNHEK